MMPDLPALYAAIDGTWPAARRIETPRWTLRDGDGGGKRVSCATSRPGWSVAEIAAWREAAARRPRRSGRATRLVCLWKAPRGVG